MTTEALKADFSARSRESVPANVPGDFCVENDTCLMCAAPEHEAPELMGWEYGSGSCYFKRQPANETELDHAIRAVLSSCVEGLRYAGNDPAILRRLVDAGARNCCDARTPIYPSQAMPFTSQPPRRLFSWLSKLWPRRR
jgi:hypothetical protein